MTISRAQPRQLPTPFVSYLTDEGYGATTRTTPSSAVYATADRVHYMPIVIPTTTRFYRGFWLNGATVGTNNLQVGLYNDNDDGTDGPGTLFTSSIPALSAGTVNLAQFVDIGRPVANIVTSGVSTTDGTSFTTGSVALKTGKLYTMCFVNSKASAADAASSIDSGPTFTSRVSTTFDTSTAKRVSMWSAVPTTPYSGTLVINFGANTETGCGWVLLEWQNVDTATNDGIVQTATGTGNSTTPLATLAAFGSTNNATLGFQGNAISAATPGTGFFEIADNTYATPSTFFSAEWRPDNDTTVDATITSGQWGMLAAEVKASLAPTDGVVVPSGRYWLAIHCNGTTATIFRGSSSSTFGRYAGVYLQNMATTTGNYLPNVAVPAQNATSYLPVFGFTTISSP